MNNKIRGTESNWFRDFCCGSESDTKKKCVHNVFSMHFNDTRHNYTSHSEGASGDKYKRTLIELRATVYSLIFGRVPLVHAELYSDSNRVLSFE